MRSYPQPRVAYFLALSMLFLAACERRPEGIYTSQLDSTIAVRDVASGQELYAEARKHLTSDAAKAEELLRRCLDADLYHGLAHNNLGVLLLAKGEVYSAVQEFEWARKLLPGHPDPRVNLAVALAQADKTSDAMEAAKAALEVQPGYIPAIQTLSYLQISTLQSDEQTDGLLASVVERGESDAWKDWARAERLKLAARRDLLK